MSEHQPTEIVALSPLADPVVAAIFSDVDSAGLAIQSFLGAALAEDGVRIGKVIEVTPQSYYKHPGERGCRIDVKASTDDNERALFEVQLNPDPTIFRRNLFSAARMLTDSSKSGTTHAELAESMPKVISINILNYDIRRDSKHFLQPIKLLYTKPPHTVALPQFSIYNIQLPRFRESEQDFNNPLYCWIYAMDTAMRQKVTIREVISMTPELQHFATGDTGFVQYCERYDRVASDPDTRDEYYNWIDEQIRQHGMMLGAEEKGRLRGVKEGLKEGKLEAARSFLAMGLPSEQVAKGTGLPLSTVLKLRGQ
jgi:predicted transposase/invertase (TIGR01784 family)